MFTKKDKQQLKNKGISLQTIQEQIDNFSNGFPFLNIIKPAIIKNGVLLLKDEENEKYIKLFEDSINSKNIVKFVPASGAATRLFRKLFNYYNNYHGTQEEYLEIISDRSFESIYYFFEHLTNFVFYDKFKKILISKKFSSDGQIREKDYYKIIEYILTKKGLNYGYKPKGLILFHRYEEGNRTPVEEHLVEGANYCASNSKVNICFTISPEHKQLFSKYLKKITKAYEKAFNVKYNITLSEQKPSTDIIAVDLNNNPIRNDDKSLLFRPGGHGALIENLNQINADIIFIKNIDNVVLDSLKDDTYFYKKVLAGLLLSYQNKIFNYLEKLEKKSKVDSKLIDEIDTFIQKELCVIPNPDFDKFKKEEKIKYFITKLNRPIRVCGMVKNEGEPGGGPYWVENQDKTASLQIIEGSQFNKNDKKQLNIINKSTHFNPVDIVCGVKDYKGNKFDLTEFIDKITGFISQKTKDGVELKAQELPGLWNGAMSDWNTIFTQVPISTFNPVKIINDLLRKEHQRNEDLIT
ncbi:MAG: DUF4301 family protein [Bacteroidales bacterium]|nr:DUF4301 family protein [Bacteroidales bacterium]